MAPSPPPFLRAFGRRAGSGEETETAEGRGGGGGSLIPISCSTRGLHSPSEEGSPSSSTAVRPVRVQQRTALRCCAVLCYALSWSPLPSPLACAVELDGAAFTRSAPGWNVGNRGEKKCSGRIIPPLPSPLSPRLAIRRSDPVGAMRDGMRPKMVRRGGGLRSL